MGSILNLGNIFIVELFSWDTLAYKDMIRPLIFNLLVLCLNYTSTYLTTELSHATSVNIPWNTGHRNPGVNLSRVLSHQALPAFSLLPAGTVRPICLPFFDEELTPATPLWVIGWGFTKQDGGKSWAQEHRAEGAAPRGDGKEDHPGGKKPILEI